MSGRFGQLNTAELQHVLVGLLAAKDGPLRSSPIIDELTLEVGTALDEALLDDVLIDPRWPDEAKR